MLTAYHAFISRYISFNRLEWEIIRSRLKIVEYQKGDTIHPIGDIPSQLLFMNHGLARAYMLDENGKDYTWSIYFNDARSHMSNLFVVDYDSFIRQAPSLLNIEALEDCQCVATSYDDIQFFFTQLKKGERFGRIMAEEGYSFLHKIFIDRQTKSAAERFEIFMDSTPHLLELVPQYHIASYLGITPQHLSRLKKEHHQA